MTNSPTDIIDSNQDLLAMPVDQFGRYGIVAQKIKELAKSKGQGQITILDIGGYKGEIHRFFNKTDASITVLDLYESNDKNYVKGSALDMPFKDNSFDYVVSFEVFEHIPRIDRTKYVEEAMRVSKGTFILTAPFSGDNDQVLKSEEYVNSLWKSMHGEDHRWLQEHIVYKTPKEKELEDILTDKKLDYKKIGNNDLILWNMMLSFNYLTTLFRDSGLNPEVQSFYNKNAEILESNTDAYYRYIYVIGTDSSILGEEKGASISVAEKRDKTNQLINKLFISTSRDIKESFATKQLELDRVAKELEQRIKMYDSLNKEFENTRKALPAPKRTLPVKIIQKTKQIFKKL